MDDYTTADSTIMAPWNASASASVIKKCMFMCTQQKEMREDDVRWPDRIEASSLQSRGSCLNATPRGIIELNLTQLLNLCIWKALSLVFASARRQLTTSRILFISSRRSDITQDTTIGYYFLKSQNGFLGRCSIFWVTNIIERNQVYHNF